MQLMTIMGAGLVSLVSRIYVCGNQGLKIEITSLTITLKDPFEELVLPVLQC